MIPGGGRSEVPWKQKHPDAETIPIIAMTANAFREDKEKCLAAGMNAHLAKPIKIENIKRILCEYCV